MELLCRYSRKKIENNIEVRIFKSKNQTNQNVIISRDTVSIFTNQAKQYADLNELHLIGPVLMINGLDTLNCNNMIFWYDRDSIQASGKVKFNFGDSQLNSDSLIYVETKGYRGYSFQTLGNSNLIDKNYKITADNILYNDDMQLMNLYSNAMVSSEKNGISGEMINIIFNDSLIKKVDIKNNGYIYNDHYAKVDNSYQLFKDEMYGNNIQVNMIDNNLNEVSINGMGQSLYYVTNELNDLMGNNKATGDTINLNYEQGILNFLNIIGDARGEFNPEKNQTKIDTILNYKAESIIYDIKNEQTMLYNDVEIEYQNTKLNSNNVIIDWETNFLYAESDENDSQISSQNQKPIIGKNLEFDLIAKKGIITLGETSVGDGIYKSKTIYRQEPNIYHMHKSIYTTCDHDEPHYYFKTPKMKMLQGEKNYSKTFNAIYL